MSLSAVSLSRCVTAPSARHVGQASKLAAAAFNCMSPYYLYTAIRIGSWPNACCFPLVTLEHQQPSFTAAIGPFSSSHPTARHPGVHATGAPCSCSSSQLTITISASVYRAQLLRSISIARRPSHAAPLRHCRSSPLWPRASRPRCLEPPGQHRCAPMSPAFPS